MRFALAYADLRFPPYNTATPAGSPVGANLVFALGKGGLIRRIPHLS